MSAPTAELRANLASEESAMGSEQRLAGAMRGFAREVGALSALRLESCIHCGICAEACHFYVATEDPKYTPILKVEPFKQVFKREASAFAPIYRWLGLKRDITVAELEEWQHLLYESCNMCGRCSLICPMGIDVAALIEQARRGMFEAGLAPKELYEKAAHQQRTGQPEETTEPYREKLLAIGREFDVNIPLDAARADVMLTVSRTDIEQYPKAVASLARVMAHLEVPCTFRSDGLIAENYGYYAGGRDWQRDISRRLIDQAIACQAKVLIVPECGHAYSVLRWQAAELYGAPLPFEVRHITEYIAEALDEGKLKLRPADAGATAFHDPCMLVRKSGVMEAPRKIMRALGIVPNEMTHHVGFDYCCGGGGGVVDIERAAKLRYRAMEMKLREIDDTMARTFLTSCSDCRRTFDDAKRHFDWEKTPQSLLELVADHLQEETR